LRNGRAAVRHRALHQVCHVDSSGILARAARGGTGAVRLVRAFSASAMVAASRALCAARMSPVSKRRIRARRAGLFPL